MGKISLRTVSRRQKIGLTVVEGDSCEQVISSIHLHQAGSLRNPPMNLTFKKNKFQASISDQDGALGTKICPSA